MAEPNVEMQVAKLGATTAGAVIAGFTLNEWVAIITITYGLIQIIVLMPKFFQTMKDFFLKMRGLL